MSWGGGGVVAGGETGVFVCMCVRVCLHICREEGSKI